MKHTRKTLSLAILVSLCSGAAFAAQELEVNNPIASANQFDAGTAVDGATSQADVDIFKLCGKQGDTYDVSAPVQSGTGHTVLTEYKYDVTKGWQVGNVSGDQSTDGTLTKVIVPESGCAMIAVSTYPMAPDPNGNVSCGLFGCDPSSNSYRLNSVLSSTASTSASSGTSTSTSSGTGSSGSDAGTTTVGIIVNARVYAPINLNSNAKIPVAILSSANFNALSVDPSSLRFGPGQAKGTCDWTGSNIDGGKLDLMCHFPVQDAFPKDLVNLDAFNRVEATLTGTTKGDKPISFEGKGSVKVVGRVHK